jgi:hypothetical protein
MKTIHKIIITTIKTNTSCYILNIMNKTMTQDDFYVLLLEGFVVGITTGLLVNVGFSSNKSYITPYFEYLVIIMSLVGSLIFLLDALSQIKDEKLIKSIIYIVGLIIGYFIMNPLVTIMSTTP